MPSSRKNCWKMKPTCWLRRPERSLSDSLLMSKPATLTTPVVGLVQRTQHVEQGRLARTGGTHDGHQLTGADAQVHAAQRLDGGVTRVGPSGILEVEDHRPKGPSGRSLGRQRWMPGQWLW